MEKQSYWQDFLTQLSELNDTDKQDLAEMFPPKRKTILITGLPRSGKTLFIRKISQNQAQQNPSLNPLFTNWLTQTDNEITLYHEIPLNQTLPEILRLELAHINEHYHLEPITNENAAMVYCCPQIGLLENKIFQEKFIFDFKG